MTSKIQQLRQGYKSVARRVQQNQIDNVLYSDVKRYRALSQQEQKRVISVGDYELLQENQFYLEKFSNFEQFMRLRKNKQISSNDLRNQGKALFINDNFVPTNSKILNNNQSNSLRPAPNAIQSMDSVTYSNQNNNNLLNPNNQSVIQDTPKFGPGYKSPTGRNISPQRQALDDFFNKKSQESQSKLVFNSLLQNPQISPRNFKKKRIENHNQLINLRNENAELKRRIFSKNNDISNQLQVKLQESYRNHELRIRDLEEQNSRLSRDNNTLRSQRTTTIISLNNLNEDDYLYSPYTFSTFNNDIYKINLRNMNSSDDRTERDISEYEPQPRHNIVYKKVGYEYENYSEQDYRNERAQANYSVFDMNRSHYSDSSEIVDAKNQNQMFTKTAIRNKIAFFKPKGIIVKNAEIEIGYKKTNPEPNSEVVKVILYFNNKTPNSKVVRINYEYEQDYYEVTVTERIRELEGFKQCRQVVQVRLRGGRVDLNSIIDMVVYVGRDTYKLWLPAMFLKISKSNGNSSRDETTKSLHPSKPFSKPSEMSKTIESLKINDSSNSEFWVDSVKGSGLVKIQWRGEKQKVKITTSQKWLDFISFLMLDPSS